MSGSSAWKTRKTEGGEGLRELGSQGGQGTGEERDVPSPFVPCPSAPSPQDAAPHLDLGSFIFEFQTFLGGRKQVVGGGNAECPLSPGSSWLSLSLHGDSVCKLGCIILILSLTAALAM